MNESVPIPLEPKMFIPLWGLASYILDTTREENKALPLLVLALYNGSLLVILFNLIGI